MRIALLEDDPSQRELLCQWLLAAGHEPHACSTGLELLALVRQSDFDALLLDWNVPDLNGIEILKQVRQTFRELPILFCTSRGEEFDVVEAFRDGADAYLVKPLRHKELLQRLEAVLQRRARAIADHQKSFDVHGLRIDMQRRTIFLNGQPVDLTKKDFELAVIFLRNVGKLLPRSRIQHDVWGPRAVTSRTLDSHVSRVRNKLGLLPSNGWRLSAVYGHGYRLDQVVSGASTVKGQTDMPKHHLA